MSEDVYDDGGPPKLWSRQKLIKHIFQYRTSSAKKSLIALETMVEELEAKVESAERQVRDLDRELERERKRANVAEMRLAVIGRKAT